MKLLDKVMWPKAGSYVLAVSGGVDSMVSLDLMARSGRGYELSVVFVDHGWRDVSKELELVRRRVTEYGLKLYEQSLSLSNQSEEAARRGRYAALELVRKEIGADAIVTAHHADDRIETVILAQLRGSGRKGLSALQSTDYILRPLLGLRKLEIVEYAQQHKLEWVEDPTNVDIKYRRNWVRNEILPKLKASDPDFDGWIIAKIEEADRLNLEVDDELERMVKISENNREALLKYDYIKSLSVAAVQESLAYMVQKIAPGSHIEARSLQRAGVELKTGRFKRPRQLSKRLLLSASHDTVTIEFKAP
jgi:tRNA(Ile)-lysidine synthetase-like protein